MSTDTPALITCRPIGRVISRFTEVQGMPIQTAGALDEPLQLEVYAEFEAGLRDIEGFDHLWLLTHLHQEPQERLEVVPFLDQHSHGVFATRAPARPNRLGLSLVRLLGREGRWLKLAGNDLLDGTPVLDIKPYVPRFDVRETQRIGWFEGHLDRLASTCSDGRMTGDGSPGPTTSSR